MKKILLATAAVLISASVASAADLAARPYTKAPGYAPRPIYNWTGFYIGGHIGGAFGGQQRPRTGFYQQQQRRPVHGRRAGRLRHQFSPNWVFGIEAKYSFLDTGSNPSPTAASARSPAGSATPGVRRCCTSRAATAGLTRASPTASPATAAVTATPLAAVSNTCSPRTGRARSSTSTTISAL